MSCPANLAEVRDDGLLAGPLDIDAPRARRDAAPALAAERGVLLEHRASGIRGALLRFAPDQMAVLRDERGRDHAFRPGPGAFLHRGQPVTLVAPPPRTGERAPSHTASGSIALEGVPARVARASRIYVEGIHDAELVERVWGDDLRIEGVVVEPMEGIDDLPRLVRSFQPGPHRRLGVLVDHLVDRSKERRLADQVRHPDVLVCGHPFVDIWQAVRPAAVGISAWPQVPRGTPWKEGIMAALGFKGEPRQFWTGVLQRVTSWKDLETPLITAVEQLIDFVTAGTDVEARG
jgi:hypothetical protein